MAAWVNSAGAPWLVSLAGLFARMVSVVARDSDPRGPDFFVSYTQADMAWAEWISWVLEEDGYRVLVQAWDFVPGSNWVQCMQDGIRDADRTVAVLSPDYLESVYGSAEWQAAWIQDPGGRDRRLLVVRVKESERSGLLAGVVSVDLFGVSEAVARERLQAMVAAAMSGRAKPASAPGFPGGERAVPCEPEFPGAVLQVSKLPARNPNFTGRGAELEAIGSGLAAGPVAVVAVRGLGGVGKSQLALEYAYRMGESGRYQIVGWVRADSPVTVAEDLAALAPYLGLPADDPAGEVAAEVVAALESRSAWLVVFDNAQNPGDLTNMLPRGGGHVLITSRNRVWSRIARQIDLEVFTRPESIQFLEQRTEQAESEAAAGLADQLGDLPLALAQAAAYIDIRGLTIGAYLDLYRDPVIAQRLRDEGLDSDEYPASVARTWLLHFDDLCRECPAAVELLRLCAFLDPDDIDLGIIATAAGEAGEVLAAALVDRLKRVDTVGSLARASLFAVPADGHVRVHRLVQAVTRDQLDDDQARVWTERALMVVSAAFPTDPENYESWPVCAGLAADVEAVVAHSEAYPELAAQGGALLNSLGIYLTASGQYRAARDVLERTLAIKEGVFGRSHSDVAGTLNNLGILQHKLGDLGAARASLERALAIEEATYGLSHPELGATLTTLGGVQHQQGDLGAARASLERGLAIKEAAYGLSHVKVAGTLLNLGLVQRDLRDLSAARASLERALVIFTAECGPDDPQVAGALGNLANVQRLLGDYAAARINLKRALAILEAAYGPDHPDVAGTLVNLGLTQYSLGDPQAGGAQLERALSISEAAFGPSHPQVAAVLTAIGVVQLEKGELGEAKANLERALAISQAAYGSDHPKVAALLGILGDVRRRLGDS
jgi:Tfp pilus assembly protein PilF